MPKVRTLKSQKPPEGWESIEETLEELNQKMREVERDPHEGKRRCEALWPILRIHHQKSRYIYEQYYKKKEISKELFDWCCREGYADQNLISKWKKSGFERLCCLRCVQSSGTNFGTACICRVPRKDLEDGKSVECVNCGCRGCASTD
ncbi:protein BUD31 homolog [Condylostylus longicornis]|uniref:protein BUD31 homolog n=1 Tax=Condylostylus longicornis TaxID=2530218 RepID=UPI00244DDFC0|nr:protein BUD31 homolog [Condylostylus longicornis]